MYSGKRPTEKSGTCTGAAGTAAKALLYIEGAKDLALGTEQIAKALGISKFYLCRIFKSAFGKTVSAYILESRLSRADELLLDSTLSVGEIAVSVGYSSTSYFIKKYKEFYGISPGQRRSAALSRERNKFGSN